MPNYSRPQAASEDDRTGQEEERGEERRARSVERAPSSDLGLRSGAVERRTAFDGSMGLLFPVEHCNRIQILPFIPALDHWGGSSRIFENPMFTAFVDCEPHWRDYPC